MKSIGISRLRSDPRDPRAHRFPTRVRGGPAAKPNPITARSSRGDGRESELLGSAQELDEEANLAQGRDLVKHLGLDDSRVFGRQDVLLDPRLENAIAERTLEDADATPDPRFRRVAAQQAGGQ